MAVRDLSPETDRTRSVAAPTGCCLITSDPEIREGAPVVAGTRMGVDTIVGYHAAYDGDIDRILREFPSLDRAQIDAALAWYTESEAHRLLIDNLLREQREFYDAGRSAQRVAGGSVVA